nr:pyridoxamine 5'-phosphate oxidase [uncultured Flavobacterium sp.]
MSDLANYRKSYDKSALDENEIPQDPMNLFHKWFKETEDFGGVEEVNATTISTIGLDGFPKSRVVLLKKYNEEGFVFYTNYNSEKGKAIAQNPNICMSFFWPSIERQVIIKGVAEKTSELDSENYFHSRPKGSQIGAVVSHQSEVIPNREYLEERLKSLDAEYEGKEVPRPEHWGGFLVKPVSVEFWQGRPNRLHDRIRFTLQDDFDWKIERLSS